MLEPYDASIDPWNALELSQPANVSGPGVSCQRTTGGTAHPPGLLSPGAMAFYPMVPGANCYHRIGGTSEPSPELAPGLPQFGSFPQPDLAPRGSPKVKEVCLQVPTCFATVPSQEVNLGN